ncbi:MAG: redoxin domain-containing protein [Patescibacteria group bacterium]
MPPFPIIFASDNNPFNLTNWAKNRFLVLIFYRGIWCNSCKKQLKETNEHLTEFENLQSKVVAVSADTAFKASLMKTFLKLKYPVLADHKLELIKLFQLEILEKENWIAKPAVLIFDQEGIKVFEYIGKDHEDRPSIEAILTKLKDLNLAKI